MRRWIPVLFLASGIVCGASVSMAEELLMARSSMPFSETMLVLQEQIREHGYQLSRVQRVDIGLTEFGYDTDKYRVVFFGKPREVRTLSASYPELIPYLPVKVAIFGEREETIVVTTDPDWLGEFYPASDLKPIFRRWKTDLQSIFDAIRAAE